MRCYSWAASARGVPYTLDAGFLCGPVTREMVDSRRPRIFGLVAVLNEEEVPTFSVREQVSVAGEIFRYIDPLSQVLPVPVLVERCGRIIVTRRALDCLIQCKPGRRSFYLMLAMVEGSLLQPA
jgi:hypothetical protein